ncbi:MAG: VOC family protein [Candidatus Odyssella sp.]|nr:VOC family protein [Candidatus Odyssella sp.]
MTSQLCLSAGSPAELTAWRDRLRKHGVPVSEEIEHETIRSICFRDPSGHALEITLAGAAAGGGRRPRRRADDRRDVRNFRRSRAQGHDRRHVAAQGRHGARDHGGGAMMPSPFVLDAPEFAPHLAGAAARGGAVRPSTRRDRCRRRARRIPRA